MVKGSKAHRELALRLADRQFALGHHLGRRLGHLLCHSLDHPLCHSLGHLLCDGLGRRLFMVTITRLARVKEEMGDREGAEDLRQEACESC